MSVIEGRALKCNLFIEALSGSTWSLGLLCLCENRCPQTAPGAFSRILISLQNKESKPQKPRISVLERRNHWVVIIDLWLNSTVLALLCPFKLFVFKQWICLYSRWGSLLWDYNSVWSPEAIFHFYSGVFTHFWLTNVNGNAPLSLRCVLCGHGSYEAAVTLQRSRNSAAHFWRMWRYIKHRMRGAGKAIDLGCFWGQPTRPSGWMRRVRRLTGLEWNEQTRLDSNVDSVKLSLFSLLIDQCVTFECTGDLWVMWNNQCVHIYCGTVAPIGDGWNCSLHSVRLERDGTRVCIKYELSWLKVTWVQS